MFLLIVLYYVILSAKSCAFNDAEWNKIIYLLWFILRYILLQVHQYLFYCCLSLIWLHFRNKTAELNASVISSFILNETLLFLKLWQICWCISLRKNHCAVLHCSIFVILLILSYISRLTFLWINKIISFLWMICFMLFCLFLMCKCSMW